MKAKHHFSRGYSCTGYTSGIRTNKSRKPSSAKERNRILILLTLFLYPAGTMVTKSNSTSIPRIIQQEPI
jgi:hypothetical protein